MRPASDLVKRREAFGAGPGPAGAVAEFIDAFAAKHAPGATVHVGHDHVPEAILKAAGAVGAEAIVMASHPPDDLRALFIGTNAAKVVRHAEVPVLVVR